MTFRLNAEGVLVLVKFPQFFGGVKVMVLFFPPKVFTLVNFSRTFLGVFQGLGGVFEKTRF